MTKKEKHSEISIQLVNKEEVDILVTLARDTFVAAFGSYNTESDMNQYLDERVTINYMTKELDTDGSFFYFAKMNGTLIGYLKLNIDQAQNEPLGPKSLELERIYVISTQQGQGIGQQLLNFAYSMAKEWNKSTIWLGVWDQNPGAIKLYERNGFQPFGSHDFQLGDDLQTDILMKMELENEA
ncbi:MAG: GNAT family N-acetyltransferase [Cytophagales bacterium]|nr:GNAT family N-acetyltransferase [Cytophagales bacterium]